MDYRRLSTGDAVDLGILSKPAPKTGKPEGRKEVDLDVGGIEESRVASLLDEGCVVVCSEYYGIPMAWRTENGRFRAVLLQYRNITEEHDFGDSTETSEWFMWTAYAVAG